MTESYKLKKQVVVSASEAAEMILRYVEVCYSPPACPLPLSCLLHVILRIVTLTRTDSEMQGGQHPSQRTTAERGDVRVP